MNVEQKINSIVESIAGLSYEFNDWSRANVKLDMKVLPTCLYLLPVSGLLYNHNGNFRDYPNALIAFLDKADFDFEGGENESTIERMKQYARKFIIAVNNSGMFSPLLENVPYSVVYDKLDVNVTGVVIQVQLKELQGTCVR
jgi:hypothetical protein